MSAALTRAAKEAAIQKALSRAFGARITQLDAALTRLADDLYEHYFGAEAKTVAKVPQRWLTMRSEVRLQSAGWGRSASREADRFSEQWPDDDLKMSSSRPVPAEHSYSKPYVAPETPALKAQADSVAKEHQAIAKDRAQLRTSLNALLAPIRTYKKLREVWPEGEDLFPPEPKQAFPVQDARLTLEINKALGITKIKGTSK